MSTNNIFHVAQYIQPIIISTCKQCENYYYFTLSLSILSEIWCVVYTYTRSQFGLFTPEVLSSHVWLVAVTLDTADPRQLAPR